MEEEQNNGPAKSNLKKSGTLPYKVPKAAFDSRKQSNKSKSPDETQEINPNTGLSTKEEKKLKLQYDAIADVDDVDLNAWQRQTKVNQFMVDLEVRRMITKLLEPVYSNQTKIQEVLLNTVGVKMVKLSDRVADLEFITYKGGTKDDRFSNLETRINDLQHEQKLFIQKIDDQFQQLSKSMTELGFRGDAINQRTNTVEQLVQSIQVKTLANEERQAKVIQNQIILIENYVKESNKQQKVMKDQLDLVLDKISSITTTQIDHQSMIDALSSTSKLHVQQIEQLKIQTQQLQVNKQEAVEFRDFKKETEHHFVSTDIKLTQSFNDGKACANYLEKYFPLYIQRQMTDFVEYVFPERPIKWRINWYNEIKIPMLTAGVLTDTGYESLNERIDQLHEFVIKNTLPPLPNEKIPRTEEEEFVLLALKNRVVHSKAKLIIMQLIGQIQNPNKKLSKTKIKIDPHEVTVSQLYGEMYRIFKDENPEVLDSLLMDVGVEEQLEQDNKMIEEDLQTDMSIEARVEREVRKQIKNTADSIEAKLSETQNHNIELLNRLQKQSEKQLNERCSTIQGYIQEVHKFQIDEMGNFKQCHQMYLYSAQQFDRKIQLVYDIEKNYQQILRQIKALHMNISELSEVNLAYLTGKNNQALTSFNDKPKQQLSSQHSHKSMKSPTPPSILQSTNQLKQDSPSRLVELQQSTKAKSQIKIAGNESQTTRVASSSQNQQNNFTRARSSHLQKRNAAQSAMSHYDQTKPIQGSIQVINQEFNLHSSRPKTQMEFQRNRQRNVSQFATINQLSQRQNLNQNMNPTTQIETSNQAERATLKSVNLQTSKIQHQGHPSYAQNQMAEQIFQIQRRAIGNTKKVDQLMMADNKDLEAGAISRLNSNKLKQPKPVMPTAENFKNQLINFKSRLQNTQVVDKFNNNILTEQSKKFNVHHFQTNQIELGPNLKMTLGVRREEKNQDGNQFLRLPDSTSPIFKEPTSLDGNIEIFNKAAGLEHQSNKNVNEIIFDKAAVMSSMKNFM